MVASGSFAGPFAINIMGFDRGPVVETKDMVRLDLVRGETEIVPVDLVETSGEGPVVDVMLISYSGDAAVADVDEQGVRVPAGGEGSLGLTITVDGSVKLGRTWTMVVVSSTAPPVAIEVEVVDADETWTPSTMYWVVLGVLMLAMVIFFILPNMGKPTVIDDYALDEE